MATAKICGLSTPDAVEAALSGGASHLGFVAFPKSPRHVEPQDAAHLAGPARGRARIVAVLVDPDDDLLRRVASTLKPDLIQLHGRETPRRVMEAGVIAGAGAIKALSVAEPSDLDGAAAYEPVCTHLMFDAKPPAGSALPGGVGARFDWSMLQGRCFARPWFLAGGLDPANVEAAIAAAGAPMVDVSSGVERSPGCKDPALVSAFLQAVRRA